MGVCLVCVRECMFGVCVACFLSGGEEGMGDGKRACARERGTHDDNSERYLNPSILSN